MSKGFKMRGNKGGNSEFAKSNVDWNAINSQVSEGTHAARVVQIIDLGMHQDTIRLGDKGFTAFNSDEDAEQFIEDMKEIYGEKHEVFKNGDPDVLDADEEDFDEKRVKVLKKVKDSWVEDKDGDYNYLVKCNQYGGYDKNGNPIEYQEIAVIADCTEMYVDYGDEIGEKQYRILLNKSFKGNLQGWQMKKCRPENDGGVWTLKPNTTFAQLINATGNKDLLSVDLAEADISEILGDAFNISITKAQGAGDKEYVNIGKVVSLKRKKNKETGKMETEAVDELDDEPMCIMFDDVTVEDLKKAHIRGDVIKHIKKANDYEGSDMQVAIEEYEAYLKSKAKSSDENEDHDEDEEEEDAEEEKPTRKVKKSTKSTKTVKSTKSSKNDDLGDDDDTDGDDDDDNDNEWGS